MTARLFSPNDIADRWGVTVRHARRVMREEMRCIAIGVRALRVTEGVLKSFEEGRTREPWQVAASIDGRTRRSGGAMSGRRKAGAPLEAQNAGTSGQLSEPSSGLSKKAREYPWTTPRLRTRSKMQ